MGVIPPPPGFNRGLREACDRHGALLIMDEVLTGFRVGPAGWWGLEGAVEDWSPDLFTYGKVIGGGLPLAAVAGPAALLDMLAPAGPVYQAGTLSGNPAAATAGLTTLRLLDADAYATLDTVADRVTALAGSALDAAAVPHTINRAGNLFSVFFTADPVVNIQSARTQNTKAYARFFHAALDAGLWLPPSAFEAWFVSTSHGTEELARVATALAAGAAAARTGAVDQCSPTPT